MLLDFNTSWSINYLQLLQSFQSDQFTKQQPPGSQPPPRRQGDKNSKNSCHVCLVLVERSSKLRQSAERLKVQSFKAKNGRKMCQWTEFKVGTKNSKFRHNGSKSFGIFFGQMYRSVFFAETFECRIDLFGHQSWLLVTVLKWLLWIVKCNKWHVVLVLYYSILLLKYIKNVSKSPL